MNKRHRAFLQFVRKVSDIGSLYTIEDLDDFAHVAMRDFPAYVRLIEAFRHLAMQAESDVIPRSRPITTKKVANRRPEMHLFDLLREKRLFPTNSDLADFAASVLPDIKGHRFDKMSRGDIATRIIEHLETLDSTTRKRLEESMRNALSDKDTTKGDKRSFFSQWERIIKGM